MDWAQNVQCCDMKPSEEEVSFPLVRTRTGIHRSASPQSLCCAHATVGHLRNLIVKHLHLHTLKDRYHLAVQAKTCMLA